MLALTREDKIDTAHISGIWLVYFQGIQYIFCMKGSYKIYIESHKTKIPIKSKPDYIIEE